MEPQTIYWRDRVSNLLQWGVGLFVLFAGWAIDNYERFKVKMPWPEGRNEIVGAIGLLAVTFIYSIVLLLGIKTIYRKFLEKAHTDQTVLPYKFAMLCAWVLVIFTLTLAFLIVFI